MDLLPKEKDEVLITTNFKKIKFTYYLSNTLVLSLQEHYSIMKIPTSASVLTAFSVTVCTILFSHGSAVSQKPTFVCGTSKDGLPATIVQSPQHGDVAFITWNSGFFKDGGFDDQKRCNIVSEKMQKYYDQGTLKYFIAGKVNRQPAICVVPSKKDDSFCNNDTLLFTLKPGSNAEETVQRLFDMKSGAGGEGLYENNNVSASERTYISFEEALERKANEGTVSNQEASSIEPQNSGDNLDNEPLF